MQVGFGPFAFDPQSGLLRRGGTEIALPPRVLGVLELLIERSGQVVARQDLLDRVWKDAFVTDTSLAEAVSFLRQALGDDPQSPTYIQTVHRRGYRFVAPLTEMATPPTARPASGTHPAVEPAEMAGTAPALSLPLERRLGARPSIAMDFLPWFVAVLSVTVAGTALWSGLRRSSPEPAAVARFELHPPAGTFFDRRAAALAVSPDGRAIAWSGCEAASGTCALFVRQVDALAPFRLAGTDDGAAPFFSPDGRWLAFFADGKLRKVAVSGGAPVALADAPVAGGGSWNDRGRIVFSGLPAGGLSIVSDQGGDVTPLTAPAPGKGDVRHAWPSWLTDDAILFSVETSPVPGAPGRLGVVSAATRAWRTIRTGVTRAVPAGPGYLLVASGNDLQAVTFDEQTLTVTGASDSVFDALAAADGAPQFAAGGGVLIALRSPAAPRVVSWSDATGSDAPGRALGNAARLAQLTMAPDGRQAAGVVADATGSDVWTVDLESGALARRSFGGTNASPAWDPRGGLIYATKGTDGLFRVSSGAAARDAHLFPKDMSADGRIAAIETLTDGRASLVVVESGKAPQRLVDGPFDETSAAFSPDGAWIAFDSDESGRREVYVQRARGGPRTQVSAHGGLHPSWSRDGRAVLFQEGRRLVRVGLTSSGSPGTAPEILYDRPGGRVVGVAPDGRYLVERQSVDADAAVVVLQWLRELRQRLPLPVNAPR